MSGRKSIVVKLVLIMLLISLITGGIILSVALHEQRLSLENNLIEENKRFAQVAAISIEAGYVEHSWPFRTLSQINDSEEVLFWWIVEPDGTIHLADDHAMCGKIVDFKSFETEEEAAAVVVVKDYVYRGEDIKFLVQPLRIGEPGKVWYLCIGISLKSVTAAANRMIITSLCYFSLIIAFACLLAFLFARRFTKPILHLVEGTKAIAGGDFDTKVEIKTGNEIEGLGDAFNKMAEQIKSSFALEKTAREELQKSEEKYRSLVESTEDMVYLMAKDCRFIFVNDKYLSRFGGLSIDQVIDRAYGEFHSAEETKEFAEIVNQVFETGKSIQSEHRSLRDGRYFLRTLSPVKNSEGRTTAVTVVSKDITEHKQADEEVKKSHKFLDTIIETIPDSLYIKDRQFRFVEVNKAFCRTHKVTKGEILGESRHRETDEEVFKTGKELEIPEQYYTDAEGDQQWTHLKKVPLTDESGNITHVLTISRDVTERKRAEDKIKASLKEKEVLLREIHHRVKNNLQIISSMLNMQARKAKDKNVIDSLLDSRSRIQTISLIHTQLYQSENLEQVEMGTTIRKLVSFLLQIHTEAKKNIKSVVTAEGVILSISQAIPCGLIINELVSNALKHAFTGMTEGSIEISMRELADDRIELTVKDNGVGIPEGLDIYKSDTLGLKIVRTLAEDQLKGKMGLIRDKGTEFYVQFDKSITN